MHAPKFRWELNANSIPIIVLLVGTLIGWGYFLNDYQNGLSAVTKTAEELQAEVRRIDQATRRFEALEMRLNSVERQASNAETAMREVRESINELSSDVRLTREILQRLERQFGGDRYPQVLPPGGAR